MPISNGVMSIAPNDIPTPPGAHFWSAFDNNETEVSARWLVRFAKERDKGWEPFTYAEIDKFYGDGGCADFGFNELISGGWILEVKPQVYHFTEDFISRCYRAATKV